MRAEYCHVSHQIDSYMDACDDAEEFDSMVAEIVNEMMEPGAEYDPLRQDNVSEALGEANQDWWTKFSAALRAGENTTAMVVEWSREYWGDLATRIAEEKIHSEHEGD